MSDYLIELIYELRLYLNLIKYFGINIEFLHWNFFDHYRSNSKSGFKSFDAKRFIVTFNKFFFDRSKRNDSYIYNDKEALKINYIYLNVPELIISTKKPLIRGYINGGGGEI